MDICGVNIESLLDILGEYKDAGSDNISFNCPFCIKKVDKIDRKHKLNVHVYTGKWRCWRCDSRGSDINKLLKSLNIEVSLDISNFYDKLYTALNLKEDEPKEESEEYKLILPENIYKLIEGSKVHEYLLYRGLSEDQIQYYNIHQSDTEVFLPIYENNNLVFYQTRNIYKKFYKNPKKLKKSNYVFNIDHSYDTTIICEGIFSSIAAGVNSVAILGKVVSEVQLDKLIKKDSKIYFCCLEVDYFENNVNLAKKLYKLGKSVRVVVLPKYKDPADLTTKEFQVCINESLPYTDDVIDLLKINFHNKL